MQEYELTVWHDLCAMLQIRGAVTEADLRASVMRTDTPGQRLLGQIRNWALAYHELASASERKEG